MDYTFEKAEMDQADEIWEILNGAIHRRKQDGSNQWQDGYPNQSVIDIQIQLSGKNHHSSTCKLSIIR